MTSQHIDNDTLSLFVKMTLYPHDHSMNSSQYHAVLDHLAHCEECRDQVSIITTLHKEWQQMDIHADLSDEKQQLICDYLDGNLTAEEASKTKKLINSHPDAMKAALHYSSHAQSMKAQLTDNQQSVSSAQSANKTSDQSFVPHLTSFVKRLFSFQSPLVYTMTATAAVFVAVLLFVQSTEINQTMIASYQDNPTIQFTDKNKLPGIGFFAKSMDSSKSFENVNIELISENRIKISWPAVAGAELYKMRIQVFNQGKKTVLKEKTTHTNHTTFELSQELPVVKQDKHNKRYEWVLYGNTEDDRMFYASGGFVVDKVHANSDWEAGW